MSSKNPLVRAWAPTIDSEIEGRLDCDGLHLTYATDNFPSHGIRVYRDGTIVDMHVVFDASGIEAEGVEGALNILAGLTSEDNHGTEFVQDGSCAQPPPEGAYPDNPTDVPP
jgi:hypothetical protein